MLGTTAEMFNELLNDCDFSLAHVNSELIVEPYMGRGSSIILHGSLGFAHGLDPLNFQMVHGYLGLSGLDVAHGAA